VELRQSLRIGVPALWVLATLAMLATVGVPTAHDLLFVWLGLGMAAFSAVDARRRLPRLVFEWAPFVAVLFVYDLLRGVADGLLFAAHETPQIHAENALFGTPAPTVWLQSHLWHGAGHLHWWDYATWFVYLTHFFATLIVAAVLWTFVHDRFARYATMVCVLAAVGFATYVLYPASPPWLAAQHGNIGESNRIIPIVWRSIPIDHFNALFEHGVQYANNVAAMPSLHAAYALLITLYLWALVPRWWRPLLAVYPFAMTVALVYTGEHYLVDCVAGWLYAVAVYAAVQLAFGRRARRVAVEPVPAD
jgi:membrane-associated phospholipid phosphatase